MTDFFEKISHALVTGIVVTLTALNGTVMHPVIFPVQIQPATPAVTTSLPAASTTSNAVALQNLPMPETTSSPTTAPAYGATIPTPVSDSPVSAPPVPGVSHPTITPNVVHAAAAAASTGVHPSAIVKVPAVSIAPSSITAAWIFAHTTTTFQQTYSGSYEASLATTVNGQVVLWGFDSTSFGGTNGIPIFTANISCNPTPSSEPTVENGALLFAVASTYTCTVALTPYTGSDRRTQTETISFTTPAGQLTISRAPSMDALLVNNENDGGITFTNTDPRPVNITGLTFAVSYSYLSTSSRPLVMRLLTPGTDEQLSDYHLEDLPADPSQPYTEATSSLQASVVFTVPGSGQTMLPIEMLGVSKMLMSNTTPDITITLLGVTTNRSSLKTVLNSPTVTWSCDVVLGDYNPNDPDASEECHN